MKNTILLLTILFLCLGHLNAQNCCVPTILHDTYEGDVKHLALLRMEQFNAPELNFVEIDQTWQDTIWEGLAAIYHSQSVGRNAVFNQYCIHHVNFTWWDYLRVHQSIYIRLDPNAPWYQNWVNGNIITNDGFVDSLLQKYGFETINYSFPSINIFRLTTTQFINVLPLVDSLAMSSNIIFAEPISGVGGSMRITYQNNNGQRQYNFYFGWGDCPSGCIYWRVWSFMVDEYCNAIYLGTSGSSGIPAPTNCNVFVNTMPPFSIVGNLEICHGDTSSLTVIGGVDYHWNTGDSTASILVNPISQTSYTVTVTGSDGCSYEKSVTMAVNPLPNVSLALDRDTVCINEVNVALSGGTPMGGSFSGPSIVGNNFEPSIAGIGPHLIIYTFQDGKGCIQSDSQSLIVVDGACVSKITTPINLESVTISPNPSDGNVTLSLRNWDLPVLVQVYDAQGRMIYTDNYESERIQLTSLPKGIFLLKVSNGTSIVTGRVVVDY